MLCPTPHASHSFRLNSINLQGSAFYLSESATRKTWVWLASESAREFIWARRLPVVVATRVLEGQVRIATRFMSEGRIILNPESIPKQKTYGGRHERDDETNIFRFI